VSWVLIRGVAQLGPARPGPVRPACLWHPLSSPCLRPPPPDPFLSFDFLPRSNLPLPPPSLSLRGALGFGDVIAGVWIPEVSFPSPPRPSPSLSLSLPLPFFFPWPWPSPPGLAPPRPAPLGGGGPRRALPSPSRAPGGGSAPAPRRAPRPGLAPSRARARVPSAHAACFRACDHSRAAFNPRLNSF
jgi:hypothetical protein